mmetsp:Transcript_13455/g.37237  ORF Transcript_13455/g.37237 Transcript_13455/m.37237 type:complete len:255 (-) Transcript_13455:278-1042(-)
MSMLETMYELATHTTSNKKTTAIASLIHMQLSSSWAGLASEGARLAKGCGALLPAAAACRSSAGPRADPAAATAAATWVTVTRQPGWPTGSRSRGRGNSASASLWAGPKVSLNVEVGAPTACWSNTRREHCSQVPHESMRPSDVANKYAFSEVPLAKARTRSRTRSPVLGSSQSPSKSRAAAARPSADPGFTSVLGEGLQRPNGPAQNGGWHMHLLDSQDVGPREALHQSAEHGPPVSRRHAASAGGCHGSASN